MQIELSGIEERSARAVGNVSGTIAVHSFDLTLGIMAVDGIKLVIAGVGHDVHQVPRQCCARVLDGCVVCVAEIAGKLDERLGPEVSVVSAICVAMRIHTDKGIH